MATSLGASAIVTIRPVTPADRSELARFYAALSSDSRNARFLGATTGPTEGAVATFCGADHAHREGLVAVARMADDEEERIVGHLCLDPIGDGTFEMAIAVADGWRRHGLGRALLAEAMAWARRRGVPALRATMLATNAPVLGLIRSMRRDVRFDAPEVGVVEAVIDLRAGLPAAA